LCFLVIIGDQQIYNPLESAAEPRHITGIMPLDSSETQSGCEADRAKVRCTTRAGKVRLLSLADLDRRTAAYRRTCDLIAGIEGDLGGADQLSVGARQIAQRAAVTGALIEDIEARWLAGEDIDPVQYTTLINCQRRLFEAVGLSRRARDAIVPPRPALPAMPPLSELLQRPA
jgi:hypothetical protein